MSCELHRQKFFEIVSASGLIGSEELERTYQGNRHVPSDKERLSVEAKTRSLFAQIAAHGLKPPTHSANGLPKAESQPGYAAVFDLLRKNNLLADSASLKKAGAAARRAFFSANDPALGLDGRDEQGFDRWGYDREGFDRNGYDRENYNKSGQDNLGFTRKGFNRTGLNKNGRDALGYDYSGVDGKDFDRRGYHKDTRLDSDGYDLDGFNSNGYDRAGYDRMGLHFSGAADPNFLPDAEGYYPDGLNALGFGRDGYDADGYDRFGFGRDGYNQAGGDRNGYTRAGKVFSYLDVEGYNEYGYSSAARQGRYRHWDRMGYDDQGYNEQGLSFTGYREDGKDNAGQPRRTINAKGKLVIAKYDRDGFDENGFDRWGYNKDTGLTARDEKGKQYNTYGWVYDRKTGECVDPKNSKRRVKNEFSSIGLPRKKHKIVSAAYLPPVPPVPITPFAPMTGEQYNRANGSMGDWRRDGGYANYKSYEDRMNIQPSVGWRRAPASALRGGVIMRCPQCGQFTGGNGHACPVFGGQNVLTYHSGVVVLADNKGWVLLTPFAANFDPAYDNTGGYHHENGLDRDGYTVKGYNDRGFDRNGYNCAGYDVFGYDRDGYDQSGYNNAGTNRRGQQRGRSISDAEELAQKEGHDLLANEDLARMYSQVATGLIGKPRRVVLRAGGFATDMKGTIYADPYPLGRDADPRHNLVVTRAGIYHELGHEQFTPQDVWARVLDVAQGKREAGLGEAARQMLPRFYNIVEDGRMERVVAGNYAGAAEILAASCRLEPRWGEEVGEGVSESDQVFWSLLYTGLPYYRVRTEVRDGMTPRARKIFDELEPVMQRAVRGTPEDAYQAAVHIAKRFEEEGFIKLPPKDYSQQMPQPPRNSQQGQGQSSGEGKGKGEEQEESKGAQGSSSGGQDDKPNGQDPSGSASQEDKKGKGRDKKQEETKNGQGSSSGGQDDESKGQDSAGGASQEDKEGKGRDKKQEESKNAQGSPSGGQDDESKGQDSAGGASQEDKEGKGRDKKQEESKNAQGSSSEGNGEEESDSVDQGMGAGNADGAGIGQDGFSDEPDEFLFGNEVVDSAVRSVEREAATAIENGARARSKATTIGKPLHNALPVNDSSMSQRYRDTSSGMSVTVDVTLPKAPLYAQSGLQDRRGRHKEIAALMAKPLKAIREQAEQRLRRQSDGRLDRRQLVNAYKGMDDVYTSTKEMPKTSFAASISVDMSGSMKETVLKRELYDAVMTLGDCFEMLDMSHEVRAFGSHSAQVKSMREKFDPDRAAFLAIGDMGGTMLGDTVSLAHSSLLACEENNKIMVCMSDGLLNDHQESVRVLKEARKNGVVTFGIFFGKRPDANKMNELYGSGSWAAVEQLSDMPKVVAQRLANIFKSMK